MTVDKSQFFVKDLNDNMTLLVGKNSNRFALRSAASPCWLFIWDLRVSHRLRCRCCSSVLIILTFERPHFSYFVVLVFSLSCVSKMSPNVTSHTASH